MRLSHLSHRTIAEYVGTAREVVTIQMNKLRRLGYVAYSRLYTDVYVDGLAASLQGRGMPKRAVSPLEQTVSELRSRSESRL